MSKGSSRGSSLAARILWHLRVYRYLPRTLRNVSLEMRANRTVLVTLTRCVNAGHYNVYLPTVFFSLYTRLTIVTLGNADTHGNSLGVRFPRGGGGERGGNEFRRFTIRKGVAGETLCTVINMIIETIAVRALAARRKENNQNKDKIVLKCANVYDVLFGDVG